MKTLKFIIIGLALFGCNKKVADSLTLEQFGFDKEVPMVILDNKTISVKTFRILNKDSIGGIRVLRHEAAKKEYGTDGLNGVIIITSKSLRTMEDKKALQVLRGYFLGENELDDYLFIIDGVPLNNQNRKKFQDFDFMEIKSLSDLGASTAKALYGSRARENNFIISTTE